MDRVDRLCQDILEDRVAVDSLSNEELDIVLDRFYDIAEALQDDPDERKAQAAEAILAVLQDVVDERVSATDMTCFEQAVIDAESRGSVYFEFEEYSVH
jgi:flagellar biosynthesis component FlhA